jgi:hypothetical protein
MDKTELFINKAIKIHSEKYDYSKVEYLNAKTKVTIICKLHGEFKQTPDKHLQGGCKICGIIKCSNNRKSNTKEFIEKAIKTHGDKYDYSIVDYINSKTKVTIICKDHGIFEQTPHNHLTGYACSKCKRVQLLTTKEFIEKTIKIHSEKYDYSKVEYLNAKTKVTIICKEHGAFEQLPSGHLSGKNCIKCKRVQLLTTKEFIEKAIKTHGDKYDYTKVNYINSKTKVTIICKKHGAFEQLPSGHLGGKNCIKCKGVQLSTTKEFIEKAIKTHGNKYDYSLVNYINNSTNIIITCKIHGEFKQTPANHLKGKNCSKCSNVYKMNTSEFIEKSIQLYGDKFDYSDVKYIKMKSHINIICKEHGKFQQTPDAFLRGYNGCIKCSNIGYSKPQIQWLEFLEIYYNIYIQHMGNSNQEYKIKNTKWKADGYCKETNTIFEYHGNYFHGNPKIFNPEDINTLCKATYGDLYKKTLEREQKIKDLGYNLEVMWESDWNKINKSVTKLQQKIKKYLTKY